MHLKWNKEWILHHVAFSQRRVFPVFLLFIYPASHMMLHRHVRLSLIKTKRCFLLGRRWPKPLIHFSPLAGERLCDAQQRLASDWEGGGWGAG